MSGELSLVNVGEIDADEFMKILSTTIWDLTGTRVDVELVDDRPGLCSTDVTINITAVGDQPNTNTEFM